MDDETANANTAGKQQPLTPRVSTTYLFPDNPFHMVVNGEPVSMLLGFHNHGLSDEVLEAMPEKERESLDQTLQLVGIQGYFTQPNDYERVLRNVCTMRQSSLNIRIIRRQ